MRSCNNFVLLNGSGALLVDAEHLRATLAPQCTRPPLYCAASNYAALQGLSEQRQRETACGKRPEVNSKTLLVVDMECDAKPKKAPRMHLKRLLRDVGQPVVLFNFATYLDEPTCEILCNASGSASQIDASGAIVAEELPANSLHSSPQQHAESLARQLQMPVAEPLTKEAVRRHYRELARRYHPDKNPSGNVEHFQALQVVYEELCALLNSFTT